MRRSPLVLVLALLGCPKPIEPTQEVEPASTTAEPVVELPPGPCTYDDECPSTEICDGGECLRSPEIAGASNLCGLPAIEFARDSARLSPNNQQRLADAAACLRALASLELAACASPDEPADLAERRAASVSGLLESLGLPTDHLRVVPCPTSSGRFVRLLGN